jgi:hypothetical protein
MNNMALPKNSDTPRGEELRKILQAAESSMRDWPQPNKNDIVIIGGIVVLFSYVDFNLRRLVEVFHYANLLPEEWKIKISKLDSAQLARAVWETKVWAGPADIAALKELEELRLLRNLVAHFMVRRFPNDDAYLFVTKSAQDYKRAFGAEPELGVAMTAIVECQQVKGALHRIEYLHNWLAKVVPAFEKQIGPPLKPDVAK